MAAQFRQRAPLGLALQNSIMPGDQPDYTPVPGLGAQPPQKGGFFKEGGMGRTIAGLIGDALLQQGGMAPVFSPMQRQQQAMKAEDAQWSRRRQEANQDWMARQQWEIANKPRDVSPIERDARAWAEMPPELREAYKQAQMVRPQFIPDGLGGGQWASPAGAPSPGTQPQIGAVIADPRKAGGPTQPASGGF